jgi:hypothetical protein
MEIWIIIFLYQIHFCRRHSSMIHKHTTSYSQFSSMSTFHTPCPLLPKAVLLITCCHCGAKLLTIVNVYNFKHGSQRPSLLDYMWSQNVHISSHPLLCKGGLSVTSSSQDWSPMTTCGLPIINSDCTSHFYSNPMTYSSHLEVYVWNILQLFY